MRVAPQTFYRFCCFVLFCFGFCFGCFAVGKFQLTWKVLRGAGWPQIYCLQSARFKGVRCYIWQHLGFLSPELGVLASIKPLNQWFCGRLLCTEYVSKHPAEMKAEPHHFPRIAANDASHPPVYGAELLSHNSHSDGINI